MKLFAMKSLEASLSYYRTQHRTPGCKLTHMFGVPLLLMAPPAALVSKKAALVCVAAGTGLQIAGHRIFEGNQPTLTETYDLTTIAASLIFVAEEWTDVITGQWIAKNGFDLWKKIDLPPAVYEIGSETVLQP